ncbi:MAG TPA: DUF4159 domain-containing protein, partial [Candidatus Eisenbacteria bacterium]|nr:DUF4159 domain-containing protein [Candidatus Eisenbacteria bacterium]
MILQVYMGQLFRAMERRLLPGIVVLGLGAAVPAAPALAQSRMSGAQPRASAAASSDLTGGFTLARLKYTGGGDWYSDESSLRNLLRTLKSRGDVRVTQAREAVVTAADPELWNYPMLFMTGH